MNEQRQVFARVVWLGQNRIPHIAIEHTTKWLWYQSKLSPAALWSGTNEHPAWPDELTQHHDFDDKLESGVSEGT